MGRQAVEGHLRGLPRERHGLLRHVQQAHAHGRRRERDGPEGYNLRRVAGPRRRDRRQLHPVLLPRLEPGHRPVGPPGPRVGRVPLDRRNPRLVHVLEVDDVRDDGEVVGGPRRVPRQPQLLLERPADGDVPRRRRARDGPHRPDAGVGRARRRDGLHLERVRRVAGQPAEVHAVDVAAHRLPVGEHLLRLGLAPLHLVPDHVPLLLRRLLPRHRDEALLDAAEHDRDHRRPLRLRRGRRVPALLAPRRREPGEPGEEEERPAGPGPAGPRPAAAHWGPPGYRSMAARGGAAAAAGRSAKARSGRPCPAPFPPGGSGRPAEAEALLELWRVTSTSWFEAGRGPQTNCEGGEGRAPRGWAGRKRLVAFPDPFCPS